MDELEKANLDYTLLCKTLGKEKVDDIIDDWLELFKKHNLTHKPTITTELFNHVKTMIKLNSPLF